MRILLAEVFQDALHRRYQLQIVRQGVHLCMDLHCSDQPADLRDGKGRARVPSHDRRKDHAKRFNFMLLSHTFLDPWGAYGTLC